MKPQYTDGQSTRNGVKCCIYGSAGVGKTRLAISAPRPFILSAENGLLSLRKERIPYAQIQDYASLVDAYNWVMKSAEAKQFDTIFLDSMSEIGETVLFDLKKKMKDPRKLYPELEDQMIGLMRDFRDMPQKHVVFIAKMNTTTDGLSGAKFYQPKMPGNKLPEAVPYFFDEVFHLGVYPNPENPAQTFGAFRTQPDQQYAAKDRSGSLDLWEPANIGHVFNKIMKG